MALPFARTLHALHQPLALPVGALVWVSSGLTLLWLGWFFTATLTHSVASRSVELMEQKRPQRQMARSDQGHYREQTIYPAEWLVGFAAGDCGLITVNQSAWLVDTNQKKRWPATVMRSQTDLPCHFVLRTETPSPIAMNSPAPSLQAQLSINTGSPAQRLLRGSNF